MKSTSPSITITIGEINIICSNINRSLTFYRDVLGFEVVEQEGIAYHLRCGQVRFLLLPIAESNLARPPYGQTPEFSVDLLVDDLAKTVRHFQVHQVEFVSEWQADDKRVFIRDPDGLVFEVIQQ